MNFKVIKIVRNEQMEWLLWRFKDSAGVNKVLKYNLPYLTSEQIKKMEMRVAEYWNKIAEVLLNLSNYENSEDAINKCFQILGKDGITEPIGLAMDLLEAKEREAEKLLKNTVGIKENSKDEVYVLFYLKKMYEYLEADALSYVDENLKNEMFERLKVI